MSFHGSDSALGSSNLYLDGIPFKVGEKFKCPKKVTLPESFVQPDVTTVLSEEYTFSTEEAVLTWLADVRQSEEDRRQRELERQQTEAENAQDGDGDSSSPEEDDQTFVKEVDDDSWDIASSTERKGAWSNPVLANFSSDLLKPTPFASCSTPKNPKATAGLEAQEFDIRLFEKVDDPFNNLELQVINDMEELKNVLQESQSAQNGISVSSGMIIQETENENNNQDVELRKTGTTRKNAVKLRRSKVNNVGNTVQSNINSQEECEYVNTRDLNGGVGHHMKEDAAVSQLTPLNSSSVVSPRHTVMNPVLRGSALPPIGSSVTSVNQEAEQRIRPKSNPELELLGKEQAIVNRDSHYENIVINPANASHGKPKKSHVSPYSRHSITAEYININKNKETDNMIAAIETDAVDGGGMRGAQSSPNLFHSRNNDSNTPMSHSPPPRPSTGQSLVEELPGPIITAPCRNEKPASVSELYENVEFRPRGDRVQQRSVSLVDAPKLASPIPEVPKREPHIRVVGRSVFYENVDVHKSESDQSNESWNRFKPLPPPRPPANVTNGGMKAPDLPPKTAHPVKPGTNMQPVSRPKTSTNQAMDKEDPYASLSIEAQAFVDSLTVMGFPRPRAARAVLKLGQDHKLVVEHLCLINTMVEKGYTATLSEMALHLFTNDVNKAVKYLDLYVQFQELGFQKEKIREALVQNDIDRDKALDYLTGTA